MMVNHEGDDAILLPTRLEQRWWLMFLVFIIGGWYIGYSLQWWSLTTSL